MNDEKQRQPRILHIVFSLIRGGTEGQCARVALACAGRGAGHRVAVFERKGFFLVPVEQACGPVYELPIRHLLRWSTWRGVRGLVRYIKSNDIDLVHAWDADAAIFGGMASRIAGVPLLTSRRDMGEIYPGWKLALMHRADQRAKAVVVNAGAIKESLLVRGLDAQKIRLISNILDVSEFDRRANECLEHDLPEVPLIGIVNRLDPEKNTKLLLRAFAKIQRVCSGVKLVIAGDGPELSVLKSLASEIGITDQTVFLGEIHQVPALIQRLTLGVLVPGSNEGLSNTILEYMAGRIPSVVTDCGGNRELVGDDAGRVIPIGDEEALADALVYYLQNSDAAGKAGLMGRRRVESMCNPDEVVGQFMELYASTARSL